MTTLNSLEKHAPDLTYSLPDGSVVIHLGLIVTVYFRQGYTEQSKRAVMRCFTRFKEEFGAHLVGQFYGGYKRLTDSSFIDTTARILQTGPNDQYEWHISSAATVGEAGAYSLTILNSFEAHGDHKRSFLKMTLPWNVLKDADGAKRYQEWVIYLAEQLEAEHGYGGLSTILPFDFDSYQPMEFQLAQQYRGLEVDSPVVNFKRELLDHIKGVNWFTIVGSRLAQGLGGLDTIRCSPDLIDEIEVLQYRCGVILRAGLLPDLCPIDGKLPSAYLAVNRLLKPLRIPAPDPLHTYSPYGNCFDEESTARWYARFDQVDDI